MLEISIVGLDLAKSVFQVHGADASGVAVVKKALRREAVLRFFAKLPRCVVAMEACASAHHWGRRIAELGHEVRLVPPAYVKPYVKRQKTDAADAEAICEAALRPTMRFVALKSEAQQASAVVFRARDLLVRQKTQIINALRGHLAEYGLVAPKGPAHVARLLSLIEDPASLPAEARTPIEVLAQALGDLEAKLVRLDAEIAERARSNEEARRLMTIPGIGPVTATALVALAPPRGSFAKGRDFAAWTGLTPKQHSSGGKARIGATSRMGERSLRRLMILGASSVVNNAVRRGAPAGSWLARMLERKPRMLVTVALANKMARIAWALLAKGGTYQASPVAAA
jgi:transposase